ncbi:putative hydrolases or acyltransferases (alpha/beta hydrolase superfamily) [Pseudoloma neurophilia]|uniref:Putative hydrolases or acyltransferases (Alpha/beta hydrolase superfamily) n=1 Tax=Pseudoloma neurophilia TaxID=146866 RepID=A0A0R0M1H9_9MICR|nr:putative hydrolases or acyltransferases (alpha/beta hydrolase superfamily) [Pseudoloma neurophilia]
MEAHLLSPTFVLQLFYGEERDFDLAQLCLRSNPFFGYHTLLNDSQDIAACLKILEKYETRNIILMGHSTGCQSILYFLDRYITENKLSADVLKYLKKCILIGAVSDRLGLSRPPSYVLHHSEDVTEQLEQLNDTKKEDLMLINEIMARANPMSKFVLGKNVIKSERYLDLFQINGKDDIFSADLPDDHFKSLNRQNIPLCILQMDQDETNLIDNTEKLKKIRNSRIKIIQGDHCLTNGVDELLKVLNEEVTEL